ncbi:hypothetical protein V2L60_09020 [Staphylococcus gallinarum]
MNLKQALKITLLIVILVEEIKSVWKVSLSKRELYELHEFKKEYRRLINSIHFKNDDNP